MAGFVKGDIVIIPFPFSDLSDHKKRPAMVLADLPGNDVIYARLQVSNLQAFNLYILANKIFAADLCL